jgi:hypothetical protein
LHETLPEAPLTQRFDQGISVIAGADRGTDTEQRRERDRLEQSAPALVDRVVQAGMALRSGIGYFPSARSRIRYRAQIHRRETAKTGTIAHFFGYKNVPPLK